MDTIPNSASSKSCCKTPFWVRIGQSEGSLSREKSLFISVVWGWVDAEMFSPHVTYLAPPVSGLGGDDKVSSSAQADLEAGRKEESKRPKTLEAFRSWTAYTPM
jgi:hypothetical protein